MNRHVAVLLFAATGLSPAIGLAQEAQPAIDVSEPPPEPAQVRNDRRHDGFYLRLALGFGGLGMQRTVDATGAGSADSTISGGAVASEISLGGTPADGLVIGGSILSTQIIRPTLKRDNGPDESLDGPLHFTLVGPSIDVFPDARNGLHFGGTLGFAYAYAPAPDNELLINNLGGAGGGLSAQIGYDWWVGPQWSLGLLFRLSGATVRGETTSQGITLTETSTLQAASLGLTAVYH